MTTLFTIGYEGADLDRVLAALKSAGVAAVADVRAVVSSRKRGFSKSALCAHLEAAGLGYRHFRDLGTPAAGRRAARAGDAAGMRRVFCEQLATDAAQAALESRLLCKTRDLPGRHGADLAQTNLSDHALEARTCGSAGGRAAEILVDDLDLRPAKLDEPVAHRILQGLALAVVQDLVRRGLAHVEHRLPRPMLRADLLITHQRRSADRGSRRLRAR